ncbi:MAG: hypothetical protein IKX57_08050 [Oscillospiraceae bacterium]|nr:hypothetical protein [Oscillospiraceae bacterium]
MIKNTTGVRIRKIDCPYCGIRMEYQGAQRIQLGQWGMFLKHWDNLFSGALHVQIYECPKCGKLEMFRIHQKR